MHTADKSMKTCPSPVNIRALETNVVMSDYFPSTKMSTREDCNKGLEDVAGMERCVWLLSMSNRTALWDEFLK